MAELNALNDETVQELLKTLASKAVATKGSGPNDLTYVSWGKGSMASLPLTLITGDRIGSTALGGSEDIVAAHLQRIIDAEDPIEALENTRHDPIGKTPLSEVEQLVWRDDQPVQSVVVYRKGEKQKKLKVKNLDATAAGSFRDSFSKRFGASTDQAERIEVPTGETIKWTAIQSVCVIAVAALLGFLGSGTPTDEPTGSFRRKGLTMLLSAVLSAIGPYGFAALGAAAALFVVGRGVYKIVSKPTRSVLQLKEAG